MSLPLEGRVAFELVQQGESDTPWLAHRRLAAGQAERAQAGEAEELPGRRRDGALRAALPGCLRGGCGGDQGLAAPDGAVGSVTGAVEAETERRAEHSAVRAVLGEAGGEMGVMMLHRDPLQRARFSPGALEQATLGAAGERRPVGGRIVGMQIVHDRRRHRPVEVEKVENHALEGGMGLRRLHVAQVLRQEDLLADTHRGGRLLMRAGGDEAGELLRRENRQWCVAAGPAQQLRPAVEEPRDAVVDMAGDRPVVQQEEIGDAALAAEASQRFVVVDRDRLAGEVAARRHQGKIHRREQQVMQRARRQHHAETRIARRDLWCEENPRKFAPPQQHDRRLRRGEEGGLFRREPAQLADRGNVAHHQRQRLRRASLAFAKTPHRGRGARVAEELETADSLERGDLALAERRGEIRERRFPEGARLARRAHRAQEGTAVGTGVRLGVKAAASGIFVFRAAGRAELETAHRRRRPVVGQAEDDRETRPAARAVRERVVESAVVRREELGPALGARREVRQDDGARAGPRRALADREAGESRGRQPFDRDRVQDRRRRLLRRDPPDERFEPAARALDFDLDTVRIVAYPAVEGERTRQAVDERAKADPLNGTADAEAQELSGVVRAGLAGSRVGRGGACGARHRRRLDRHRGGSLLPAAHRAPTPAGPPARPPGRAAVGTRSGSIIRP